MQRRNWERHELLLALNLYCKLPFGRYHGRDPAIIQLAQIIDRTPNAVAMKLSNFASLDPFHQQRGISGLSNIGKADKAIWQEFQQDWNRLALESELAYLEHYYQQSPHDDLSDDMDTESPTITERTREVMVRVGQAFFRQVILNSYKERCCICELPVPQLLIASHIVPWHVAREHRLNPRNGLCLCAIHDQGFDRGLMTVSREYRVVVGQQITKHLPDQAINQYFMAYDGQAIHLPDKFIPDPQLLMIHKEQCFQG